MENSFDFGGKSFKLSKIDATKQFHIVRRIGPILSEILPGMKGEMSSMKNFDALDEDKKFELIAKIAGPFMNGLSKLSDEDSEKVLRGLLSSIEVKQQAGNWSRIANADMLLMQDMSFQTMMQLAGRAFMFNLSGFFEGLPQ